MTGRPRAADDFPAIRARLAELDGERKASAESGGCTCGEVAGTGGERIILPSQNCPVHNKPACPAAAALAIEGLTIERGAR